MNIGLCIPTLQAAREFETLLPALESSRDFFHRRLVIDSSSTDDTVSMAHEAGFETLVIPRHEFDHGGTRQKGVELLSDCDIIVFMTQDAIPTGRDSFESLVKVFEDPQVGCAYGRQLPRIGAKPIEAHARLFSYPEQSIVKIWPEARSMGIMAGAVSNSFSGYRRTVLQSVGGFPFGTICSEDVLTGFKMLQSGMKVVYQAEATVHHSHNYNFTQEFRRHFDIGAFYGRFEPWIIESTQAAEGRALHFLISQTRFLLKMDPLQIWKVPILALHKYTGYRLGTISQLLPNSLCTHLSMNPSFWNRLNTSPKPSQS